MRVTYDQKILFEVLLLVKFAKRFNQFSFNLREAAFEKKLRTFKRLIMPTVPH